MNLIKLLFGVQLLNIKNIKINNFASLAPMASVTDKTFREICANFGVVVPVCYNKIIKKHTVV